MSILVMLKAVGAFIFGSKESRAEQRVIMRRFKVALLRKIGASGAADEIDRDAQINREHEQIKKIAEIKKHQVSIAKEEAKLDKALEILEKQQAERQAKRKALIDQQHTRITQITDDGERKKALEKLNRDRDQRAEDAADQVEANDSAIRMQGGSANIDPRSIKSIDAFIGDDGNDDKNDDFESKLIRKLSKLKNPDPDAPTPTIKLKKPGAKGTGKGGKPREK